MASRAISERKGTITPLVWNTVLVAGLLLVTMGGAGPLLADHNGVPTINPDYTMDVEEWWAQHPYNPESSAYDMTIISPTPVVSLSPGDDLQTAIDSLPSTGGTVQLAAGVYNAGNVLMTGLENIHIIAPSRATVIGNINIAGCEQAAHYPPAMDDPYNYFHPCVVNAGHEEHAACLECIRNRKGGLYFQNLDFDGNNTIQPIYPTCGGAMNGTCFRDLLVHECTFANYPDDQYDWDNLIWFHATNRNAWFVGCEVDAANYNAVSVFDGGHGSGMVDCDMGSGLSGPTFLCNDDFSIDINDNGVAEPFEHNCSQYCVLYGNTFGGGTDNCLATVGRNILAKNNVVTNTVNYFWTNDSKAPHMWDQINYEYFNNKAIANNVAGCVYALMRVWKFQYSELPIQGVDCTIGNYHIRGNTTSATLTLHQGGTIIMDETVVCGNCGSSCPADFCCGGTSYYGCYPVETEPPSDPCNLQAVVLGADAVALSWTDSTDNVDVQGYEVYRDSVQVGTCGVSSYTDDTVACCTSYTYTVRAFDPSLNVSGHSSPAVASTPPAPQSADLVPDAVIDEADLAVMTGHWLDGGCGVIGDLDASGVVDLDDFAQLAAAWTGPDDQAPSVPAGLAVDAVDESSVSLSWTDSTDNLVVVGYRVFRDGGSVGTTGSSAYTDSGLANDTAYTYTVSAFDAENESAQSAPVVATTQTPPSNYLTNGSFEDGTSWPTGWSQQSWAGWDTTTAYLGSASVSGSGSINGYIDQSVTLPATGSYTISAWFKADGVTGQGLFVRYANLGGGGGDWGTYDNKVLGTTGDWVVRSKPFTAPSTTGRVDCYWEQTAGTGWIDNVVLEASD